MERGMIRLGIIAMIVLASASVASTANAQYVPPGGPTLPIELDYFRPQQGVLDNYNQFVAPKQSLANQLRAMDQRQTTAFKALDRQKREVDSIRQSGAAPTGTAAGFMNYSHYYGMPAGPAARRR
jgi:hypothetical protein